MTRSHAKPVAKATALVVAVVLALLVPVLATDPGATNFAVFIAMYVGLATAWNIMGGYTGYISLGHAAFFGFGAYAFGLVLAHLGIQSGYEPFVFVPVAGALTALLAVCIGWIAAHPRGDVRDRDHRDDVHDPTARREPGGTHRGRRRPELPGPAVER